MTRIHAHDGSLIAEYARERRIFVPINVGPEAASSPPSCRPRTSASTSTAVSTSPGIGARRLQVRHQYREPLGTGAPRAPRPSRSRWPRTSCCRATARSSASSRRRSSPSASSAPTPKDKILELYLNEIYLGMGSYGVAAAALNYFNKELQDLDHRGGRLPGGAAEGAQQLSSVPQGQGSDRPGATGSSTRWPRSATSPAEQAEAAKAKPLKVNIRPLGTQIYAADYFAEDVRRTLVNNFGEDGLYGHAERSATATGASTAASRCAPRSIPTCSAWRARR